MLDLCITDWHKIEKTQDPELLIELRRLLLITQLNENVVYSTCLQIYINGIKNLFDIYLPIVDGALIFDNSEGKHELLADKQIDGVINMINQEKFNLLKNYYDNN